MLDFFCGSGTTLLAANQLGRNWIGIDISSTAIKIAQEKLNNHNLFSKPFGLIDIKNNKYTMAR